MSRTPCDFRKQDLMPAASVFLHTCPVYTQVQPIPRSTSFTHISLYMLSVLSTCSFRRTSWRQTSFFCRLLPLHYLDVPHSTLGCVCMGGDYSCFRRGHCRVLISPPGRTFSCPRACGFLPLPLLGPGTCHLVTQGIVIDLVVLWCCLDPLSDLYSLQFSNI